MDKPERIRGKFARAIVLIEEFRQAEAKFIRTKATKATPLPDGSLQIAMKPIPQGLSAIAGDVLQDLRSALDHETYRMAAAVKGTDWSGLGECGFPIYSNEGGYAAARSRLIGVLPDEVKRAIDALQLFCEPRDAEAESLDLLNELARIDRHRLLHLTVMQATQLNAQLIPLEDAAPGTIIGEVTPETTKVVRVQMKMRLAFLESPAQGEPVGGTLVKVAMAVKRVIVRMREAETA